MPQIDAWGKAYLGLLLRLDKVVPGYVDAYFGPAEIKEEVEHEPPRSPAELRSAVEELQRELPVQGYDTDRQSFLRKQLRAAETVIARASGEEFSYIEEVERCLDITPHWVDEAVFESAHAELEALLPGVGPLRDRLQAHRNRFIVPVERVLPLVQTAAAELRRRTRELVELPEGEEVEVTLVHGQPWSAYNWYMGHSRSRIEINTDLPIRAYSLLEMFSHEAYPGHHTEATMKERLLYEQKGYAESCIAPLLAPASVIAEGIGDYGIQAIWDEMDRLQWKNEVFYPLAGVPSLSVEQTRRIDHALVQLRFVSDNAALLLHEWGRSAAEVVDYIERYALRTRVEAEHSLQFFQFPLFRPYIFCYDTGEALISAAVERTGDRRGLFRRLLAEQWTPSALAQVGKV